MKKNVRSWIQTLAITFLISTVVSSCALYQQDQSTVGQTSPSRADSSYVVQLTDANFDHYIKQGSELKVVYFTRQPNITYSEYGIILDDVVKGYEGAVFIGHLNTLFNIQTRRRYAHLYERSPAFVFYRNGNPVYWTSQEMNERYLVATIDRLLIEDGEEESANSKQ